MMRKGSILNIPQFCTMSAVDRNFIARAISKKPSDFFTVSNHPPDFGIDCIILGNTANNINGKANAIENPSMPTKGLNGNTPKRVLPFPNAASTNRFPTKGPVQLNETMTSVNAIKNMPIYPPREAKASVLFAHV